ncbi:11155_t:CDS:2 [Funneliformis mosseae]|uniref:11155_t:CDS:1 n=1 Tax=Funneliformis mosseae TaxID=27381 RepID=A0A9N8VTL9_FUNMO|nr:11155_t:CDS:2 [Funneliformis mosseae]
MQSNIVDAVRVRDIISGVSDILLLLVVSLENQNRIKRGPVLGESRDHYAVFRRASESFPDYYYSLHNISYNYLPTWRFEFQSGCLLQQKKRKYSTGFFSRTVIFHPVEVVALLAFHFTGGF